MLIACIIMAAMALLLIPCQGCRQRGLEPSQVLNTTIVDIKLAHGESLVYNSHTSGICTVSSVNRMTSMLGQEAFCICAMHE